MDLRHSGILQQLQKTVPRAFTARRLWTGVLGDRDECVAAVTIMFRRGEDYAPEAGN